MRPASTEPARTEMARGRIAAFDIARGIAIVLVVYGHCLRGLVSAGTISQASPFLVSDYVIYTFHMPLFFVISGFFLNRRSDRPASETWRGRVRTIVYPYFFWSLLHAGVLYAVQGTGASNNGITVSRILEIGFNPISPYWFLYALFFAYLLVALLGKLSAEWLVGLGLAAFGASYALCIANPFGPLVVNDIAYAFLYVTLGLLLRERQWMQRLPSSPAACLLLWLAFALATAASYLLDVPERLPLASAVLGVAALLSTCFLLERQFAGAAATRLLEILGQCSMGIFVMHVIVLGGIRLVLVRFLHIAEPGLLLALGTMAGVIIPTVAQLVAIRLGIQDLVALPSSAGKAPRADRRSVPQA